MAISLSEILVASEVDVKEPSLAVSGCGRTRCCDDVELQDSCRAAVIFGGVVAHGHERMVQGSGMGSPRLGAVHGMGLYLGVEVGSPDSPDPEGARELCEALLDEGVIVQPTGDHKNVLKIKPPLTLDAEGVTRFLGALEHVLTMAEARARL